MVTLITHIRTDAAPLVAVSAVNTAVHILMVLTERSSYTALLKLCG
jgi:hypothetical protein